MVRINHTTGGENENHVPYERDLTAFKVTRADALRRLPMTCPARPRNAAAGTLRPAAQVDGRSPVGLLG